MKKTYIILYQIILIIICLPLDSQSQDNELNRILSFFDTHKEGDRYKSNLSDSSFYKIFNYEPSEFIVSINPKKLLYNSECIILLIEIHHPQGGYSSSYDLCTFSRGGNLLRKQKIGYNSLDLDGGYECNIELYDNILLEVNEKKVKYVDEKTITIKEKFTYYQLNKNGVNQLKQTDPSYRRFPEASKRVLDKDDLKQYPIQVLDLIRNEIFAEHGYIFKTDKWKYYFKKQNWYKPNQEFSIEDLSLIEKINLKEILKIKNKSNSL